MKKWRSHNMKIGEAIARERNLNDGPAYHDRGTDWDRIKKLANQRIGKKERNWFFQSEVATPSNLLINMLVKIGILRMARPQ